MKMVIPHNDNGVFPCSSAILTFSFSTIIGISETRAVSWVAIPCIFKETVVIVSGS